MSTSIEINNQRLEGLMGLYNVSIDDILNFLNRARVNKISEADIFGGSIKLNYLREIDTEFFAKGMSYYTDPNPATTSLQSSIFFRKTNFNAELTHADYWRISLIESQINSLSVVMHMSNYTLDNQIEQKYSIDDNPIEIAQYIRTDLDLDAIRGTKDRDRKFLQAFIEALGNKGIIVHEFIEQHNLKKKTSFEGVFIAPFTISVKRQQYAFKREIYTLAHEFGHYLLGEEQIDKNPCDRVSENLEQIENWCNEFAFHFLVGEAAELYNLFEPNPTITNVSIQQKSNEISVSRLAIYRYFVSNKKISWNTYFDLRDALSAEYEEKAKQRRLDKVSQPDRKPGGRSPVPIYSQKIKDIYRHAFFEGAIEEIDVINKFNPNSDAIKKGYFDKFLYGEIV